MGGASQHCAAVRDSSSNSSSSMSASFMCELLMAIHLCTSTVAGMHVCVQTGQLESCAHASRTVLLLLSCAGQGQLQA
jgi:hypothetical protein